MSLKSKNLFSFLFILLLLSTIGLTYAYWDSLKEDSGSTVNIGVGTNIVIEEILSAEKKLIPIGAILGSNETHQIKKEYNVVLSKTFNESLYLNVNVGTILIGGSEYEGLINIDLYYNPNIVKEERVVILITINDIDIDYSIIYNKKITFSINFTVT